jgi:1-acyl-sn-glycerol-3-phosphate acyltransferase
LEDQAPARSAWRYDLARRAAGLFSRGYSGYRLEGAERLPSGPAVLCFSHANWIDPLYLMAALPSRPRAYFLGPAQEDMTRGFRNRLMRWAGVAIPFRPGSRGLLAATRRAEAVLAAGDRIVVAGEGRIHAGEAVVLPLLEGPAYFSLRSGVPLVPVAINGTSWLAFRRRVRIRIGQPIVPAAAAKSGSPSASIHIDPEASLAMTANARKSLLELVDDFPDPPRPRWLGSRLTEMFNEWPEGSRPPTPPRNPPAGANP